MSDAERPRGPRWAIEADAVSIGATVLRALADGPLGLGCADCGDPLAAVLCVERPEPASAWLRVGLVCSAHSAHGDPAWTETGTAPAPGRPH